MLRKKKVFSGIDKRKYFYKVLNNMIVHIFILEKQ